MNTPLRNKGNTLERHSRLHHRVVARKSPPARRRTAMTSMMDILPTFAGLAGAGGSFGSQNRRWTSAR
ncbi:MAG: hypothetical protein H7A53_05835 [Akkermansiaceae bacterium]|nr:hypothetical protein [Akkermansiaceae bacterium]